MQRLIRSIFAAAIFALPPFVNASAQNLTQTIFGFTNFDNSTTLILNGISFDAQDRGWYDIDGLSNGADPQNNYITGICGFDEGCATADEPPDILRDWFRFDLSAFSGTITSAVVRLQNPDGGFFNSLGGTLDFQARDVTTGFANLGTGDDINVYNDLGNGVIFGTTTVGPSANNSFVQFNFNAAGVAALNTSRENGLFAFGGLVVAPIAPVVAPEPSTWLLMLSGLGIVGFVSRRRRRSS